MAWFQIHRLFQKIRFLFKSKLNQISPHCPSFQLYIVKGLPSPSNLQVTVSSILVNLFIEVKNDKYHISPYNFPSAWKTKEMQIFAVDLVGGNGLFCLALGWLGYCSTCLLLLNVLVASDYRLWLHSFPPSYCVQFIAVRPCGSSVTGSSLGINTWLVDYVLCRFSFSLQLALCTLAILHLCFEELCIIQMICKGSFFPLSTDSCLSWVGLLPCTSFPVVNKV